MFSKEMFSANIMAALAEEGILEPTSGNAQKLADALGKAVADTLNETFLAHYNTHIHTMPDGVTGAPTVPF
ncbi:MAG: hypothetical protein ACOX2F_07175 [bacterium]